MTATPASAETKKASGATIAAAGYGTWRAWVPHCSRPGTVQRFDGGPPIGRSRASASPSFGRDLAKALQIEAFLAELDAACARRGVV
jgi:hypothetical protein